MNFSITFRQATKMNLFVSLNTTEKPILQGHAMVRLPSGIFLAEVAALSINPHSNTIYSVYNKGNVLNTITI